ncbi:MAG: hypothetical protein VB023_06605 [Oscillibacter sp.]|nr:hypothetical protein [Oscillibacter sp.]
MVTELTKKCVEDNAANAQKQDEYLARYTGYVERYNSTKAKVESLERERTLRLVRVDSFDAFIRIVKDMNAVPDEFSDKLWLKTVNTVTVKPDGTMVFRLQNGMELNG